MQSFDDDQDFGGSQDGSSEDEQNEQNEQNEQIDDVDEEGEAEEDGDVEDEDEGDGESEDDQAANEGNAPSVSNSQQSRANNIPAQVNAGKSHQVPTSLGETPALAPTAHPRPAVTLTSPSPQPSGLERMTSLAFPSVRPEALSATVYDIVPTIAAPHSTSINTITATPDLRWIFSGGSDGYIRKFNWADTANGKLMLTVAQRHPFVDSVTKAGVLASYWENEEPHAKPGDDGQALSPVYSLAVHSQALWLLSGLESGGINLQSVRHDEGKRIHCLKKHTSAVSVLNLAQDEESVLSGSWDKAIIDWDLNTGQVKRKFEGSGSQISALEMRPLSSIPVPEASGEPPPETNTIFTDNASNPRPGPISNGVDLGLDSSTSEGALVNTGASPADSLFGGNDNDSLFDDNGDDNNGMAAVPSYKNDDYDDEFSRAFNTSLQQPENEDGGEDVSMIDVGGTDEAPYLNGIPPLDEDPGASASQDPSQQANGILPPLTNGLPHAEDTQNPSSITGTEEPASEATPIADTTFLSASIDGTLRVWDKRKSTPVAKILPRNAPPWCMGACWSPDGNFIYAGRRNGTVEEFSVHKGLRGVERTFKFPNGSGAVSAVRAMPNGRHLICASYDILRLYDLQQQQTFKHSTVPFLIVPGHRTGVISQLYLDPTCRFMISTAGNRGWDGNSTQVLLGYEVNI